MVLIPLYTWYLTSFISTEHRNWWTERQNKAYVHKFRMWIILPSCQSLKGNLTQVFSADEQNHTHKTVHTKQNESMSFCIYSPNLTPTCERTLCCIYISLSVLVDHKLAGRKSHIRGSVFLFPFFLKKYFIYLFLEREEGREKERERNINVWLPLIRPLLGTWPVTQACALSGNQTGNPLVHRPTLSPLSHTSQVSVCFSCSLYHAIFLAHNTY